MRLTSNIAKSFRRRSSGTALDFADLIQESALGLNLAANKFDPSRGYSFSTMATWWCRQALARAIVTQGQTIRIPQHQVEVIRRWRYRPTGQTLASFVTNGATEKPGSKNCSTSRTRPPSAAWMHPLFLKMKKAQLPST